MLNEAEAADERCHRLLPTMWTTPPGVLRSVAAALRGPLQLMIEHQGDSLLAPRGRAGAAIERRITVALSRDFEAAVSPAMQAFPGEHEENCTCSGCGERQTTVRKCSGCYQAQYCRCALFCCPSLTPSCPRDPPPAPAHPMIVPPPCPHNTPPQPRVPEAALAGAQGGVQGRPAQPAGQLSGDRGFLCTCQARTAAASPRGCLSGKRHDVHTR